MKINISTNEDILYVCSVQKMHTLLFELLKSGIKKKISVLLMTFTKPANVIINKLSKSNLSMDNVLIVDCSGNKEKKKHKNVILIEEEENLTKMSIAAFKFVDMPKKKKLLIIDAINVLAQYNRIEDVSKMLRNIIQKDDEEMTKMLVFCTDASNKKLISEIEPFFDKTLQDKR